MPGSTSILALLLVWVVFIVRFNQQTVVVCRRLAPFGQECEDGPACVVVKHIGGGGGATPDQCTRSK